MNVWKLIDDHLMEKPLLKVERLPTFYPSAASCRSEDNETDIIGACLRANYYRCAGYEKSDEDNLWSQYVFAGGNLWERWVSDKLKEIGVHKASNLKFANIEKYISGEVDIVVEEPETGDPVILEMKTFFGYEGKKRICGNTKIKPKPKDPHLLQAFLYLSQFKDQVKKVVLMYFARDDHSRQQFVLTAYKEGDKTYPRVETNYRGELYSYVDKRITMEGIYHRYDELMDTLKKQELPAADFEHEYKDEKN